MGAILLAQAAYQRSGFPQAVLMNALTERSQTKPESEYSILARGGLEDFDTIGTAPFRGAFQKDGLLGDATFVVASTGAYLETAAGVQTAVTGAIAGDGEVIIDGGLDADLNTVIRIATGTALYIYTWDRSTGSGNVMAEDFPTAGGAGATSVAFLGGYWLASEAGTDAAYYIEPAGSGWNALEFASAEFAPDALKGLVAVGEQGALLGSATTEFWRLTGNASSPLERSGGLVFNIGCRSIFSAVNCAGDLIFVDNNCQVQLTSGGEPQLISDNGLDEQIRRTNADDLSAAFYAKDGHPLYVLHLGTAATWVYDLSTRRWSKFASLGSNYWRPKFFATMGDTVLAFDRLSNQVWRLDPDRRYDGSNVFPLEFCGFIPVSEGRLPLANITLDCLLGDAPRTGQGSDPLIGLRVSYDGGATYGPVKYRSLGITGKRSSQPRWTNLGTAKAPHGVIAKWEVADPIGRRFSMAKFNVAA